ncbi:unnamed protein product [Dibothriocephalus latus]|uniref:I/LWEQ domain-containing protein n=1 Tax=Dibothriocephalus latus TaxID=60516 RepID=A0A3P7LMC5_DIBLA|nr:unnamed protein product [Dibothriocephalus latus]
MARQQDVSKEARQNATSAVKQIANEMAKLLDGVKCVRRDVAEKFLGRHVAFHHHYLPGYGKEGSSAGSTRFASHQTSCLQMRLDSVGRVVVGEGASSEAEKRIDAALQRLEDGLNQARTHEQANTPSVQPILSMTKSIALAAREFIQAVRSSSGAGETPKTPRSNSEAATLGRSVSPNMLIMSTMLTSYLIYEYMSIFELPELSVAMATEYLCELARFCSASRPEGPTAAPKIDTQAKIQTEQAALEDLQHQLEELNRQQAVIQSDCPTDQLSSHF